MGVGLLALVAAFALAKVVLAADTGTAEMQSHLERHSRRRGSLPLTPVPDHRHSRLGAGGRRVSGLFPFADGTQRSCPEDCDRFPGRCGLFRPGGFTGMYVSIRANIRTAAAARSSLNGALQAALRGGAVTGLVVVALSLLGVGALFFFFGGLDHPADRFLISL